MTQMLSFNATFLLFPVSRAVLDRMVPAILKKKDFFYAVVFSSVPGVIFSD